MDLVVNYVDNDINILPLVLSRSRSTMITAWSLLDSTDSIGKLSAVGAYALSEDFNFVPICTHVWVPKLRFTNPKT